VKKEGHGRGGWGEDGDDRPRNNRRRDNKQEEAVAEPDEAADNEGDAAPAEVEPEIEIEAEPEPVTQSYEEYLADKEAKALAEDKRGARAVQNDDTKFAGVAITKEDEAADFQLELGTGSKQLKSKRANKSKKNVIHFDEFAASGSGRGGGRGRGRGRGGNSRGGRGYRPPSLNDSHFPKLG
jgi:plasminogen activator inhibitor 1 RNA-binding protein